MAALCASGHALQLSCKPAVSLGRHPHRQSCRPARQQRRVQTQALFGGKKGGDDGGGGNPFAALGNMGNIMENVKKAQQLVQVEAAKAQEELAAARFEGYCDDETVRVVMSGNQEPKSVEITETAMEQGSDKLSDLVTEAMRDAHSKSVEGMKTRMKELSSSLGLPQGANPLGPGL
ncbi:hypothetical protein ABBQ32_009327 [Trebouxia sp. C0010 RCD-2024]